MEKKSVLSCRPTTPKKPSKKLTVMQTAMKYAFAKRGMGHFKIFNPNGEKLEV
jgi:hypothetical protein